MPLIGQKEGDNSAGLRLASSLSYRTHKISASRVYIPKRLFPNRQRTTAFLRWGQV
jgi:hypothetical protein